MNQHRQPQHPFALRRLLAISLVVAALQPATGEAATLSVVATADEFSATGGSVCSLREAIRSVNSNANFGGCTASGTYGNDVINLAAGTYTLTRADSDENVSLNGDLDITTGALTLDGASAGTTIIKGDAGFEGRIVHVLNPGTTLTLRDMTLRDGHVINNRAGGGLRTEPNTTTTLFNVVVGANQADGDGGGILNQGTMTLNGSAVTGNVSSRTNPPAGSVDGGGGGVFNAQGGTLTLNDSRVLENVAEVQGDGNTASGGGIFNDGSLTLDNSLVDANVADDASLIGHVQTLGGGIHSSNSLRLIQSTITNNISGGNDARGGGISCAGTTTIELSMIGSNLAEQSPDLAVDRPAGGGISCRGNLTITSSNLDSNASESRGGGLHSLGITTITNTTFFANSAIRNVIAEGGGIDVDAGSLKLINSTLSENFADGRGGGIYVSGDVSMFSVTLAGNTSNADNVFGGEGGGIFLSTISGMVSMRNSVLAANRQVLGVRNDCDGTIISLGNNLLGDSSGCTLQDSVADLIDIDAQLSFAADNGGPLAGATVTGSTPLAMKTHLPLAFTSPLVDRGNGAGCKDQNNVNLVTDQLGRPRVADGPDPDIVATCDIGAVEVEVAPPTFTAAAPISRRQGASPESDATVGTVADTQSPAANLIVTRVIGGTATGITVGTISNNNGTISAPISADCSATPGTVRFQVSNGASTAAGNLQVSVFPNAPPLLSYVDTSLAIGGNASFGAIFGPADAGTVTAELQSQGTYTGMISVTALGLVTITNAAPNGAHTITIRATDNCGATTDASFTLTVSGNSAPVFTPAAAIIRQQGSRVGNAVTVGTVSDSQTSAGALTVAAVSGGSATGISIGAISNSAGTISTTLTASCSATSGTLRFQVSDGAAQATGDLQVNVVANSPPLLGSYANSNIALGGNLSIPPSLPPSDNGSVVSLLASASPNTFTGILVGSPSSGVVSVSNAGPTGSYTITVTAADNCGATGTANFGLEVRGAAVFGNGFE